MKKDEKEDKDRAWFLEKKLGEMKDYHEEEVKAEHQEWKRREVESETLDKEKARDYSKKMMKEQSGLDHRHKVDKKMGGVKGKPHPETKMDRKGRTEKS
jgi:hypothetical protein